MQNCGCVFYFVDLQGLMLALTIVLGINIKCY